jgi:restriction system-associated AAA family ATPase
MGLCLLFKDTDSLFLLDEPETHFNPDWRASLISTLKKCLVGESDDKLRELLITSHSPFIISDCHAENVLLFKKDDKTGIVDCKRPDFNTFGASVNQITIKAFGKVETISNYAKEELDKLSQRFEKGENANVLIEDANRKLGDSVEKIIFINKVLKSKGSKH